MNILVSACLLGKPCRYDGKSKPCNEVIALSEKHKLIEVCPEVLGGLPTPRTPCEIVGDMVISKTGEDRTREYCKGADLALKLARDNNCTIAVLKLKSPACGCREVYDGSFSKTLVKGMGITAKKLSENGIKVIGEDEIGIILGENDGL